MTKAIATIEKESSDFLTKCQKSLAGYANRKYDKSYFLKSAQLAILENTQLQECFKTDKGKSSLFHALRYAASTGLSLNPQEGKAALIAYRDKNGNVIVNYQVMKNGLLDLAMESGKVEFILSDVVRENDKYSGIRKTMSGDDFELTISSKDRGTIIGFFAGIKLKSGSTHACYMTIEEMEDHRDKYAKGLYYKDGNPVKDHAWHKSFEGMGLKTVIKRLFRNLSISDDLDNAVSTDDGFEGDTIDIPADGYSSEDAVSAIKKKEEEKEEKPVAAEGEDQGSLL
jgi:recombination protein RecT